MILKNWLIVLICFITMHLAACDLPNLNNTQLKLDHKITTKHYSIYVPVNWTYEIVETGTVYFKENDKLIGGLYIQPYYLNESTLLTGLLPNHSEILEQKELNSLLGKIYAFRIEETTPAVMSEKSREQWIYLFLINDKQNIYEFFFNVEFVDEKNALDIANTLKLTK